jgi:hypothetical protein
MPALLDVDEVIVWQAPHISAITEPGSPAGDSMAS